MNAIFLASAQLTPTWRDPTPMRLHWELARVAWRHSDCTNAPSNCCRNFTSLHTTVHSCNTSRPWAVCVARVGSTGLASMCERDGDAQTARQGWKDCTRRRLPPPVQLTLSGGPCRPGHRPRCEICGSVGEQHCRRIATEVDNGRCQEGDARGRMLHSLHGGRPQPSA